MTDCSRYAGIKGRLRYAREKKKLKDDAKSISEVAPKMIKLQNLKKRNDTLICTLGDEMENNEDCPESDSDSDIYNEQMKMADELHKIAELQIEKTLLESPKVPFTDPM